MPIQTKPRMLSVAEKESMKRQLAELYKSPSGVISNHSFLGHASQRHVGIDDVELLNNVIKPGGKRGDSVFDSRKDQEEAIEQVLKSKMADIIKFVSDAKPGEKRPYYINCVDEDGEPKKIGHGFFRQTPGTEGTAAPVKCIETDTACVIIQKDRRMPDGWAILTACPVTRLEASMSDYEKAEANILVLPDFDMEDILHKTETYKKATPIQRTVLNYVNVDRKHMAALPIRYKNYSGREDEHIEILDNNTRPGIRITGDTAMAVSVTESRGTRVTKNMRDTAEYLTFALRRQIDMVREQDKAKRKCARNTSDLDAAMPESGRQDAQIEL